MTSFILCTIAGAVYNNNNIMDMVVSRNDYKFSKNLTIFLIESRPVAEPCKKMDTQSLAEFQITIKRLTVMFIKETSFLSISIISEND